MPQYVGGDILEIVCKHPELGEFRFQVKAGESFNIDAGGLRSNDDANMISGGGEFIDQINRVRWSMEGPVAVDPISGNEFENLPALAASPILGTWTVTHISGTVWKGQGKPVGDLVADTNTAQLPLKVAGKGRMEKL
jgi:hypothetical protein